MFEFHTLFHTLLNKLSDTAIMFLLIVPFAFVKILCQCKDFQHSYVIKPLSAWSIKPLSTYYGYTELLALGLLYYATDFTVTYQAILVKSYN